MNLNVINLEMNILLWKKRDKNDQLKLTLGQYVHSFDYCKDDSCFCNLPYNNSFTYPNKLKLKVKTILTAQKMKKQLQQSTNDFKVLTFTLALMAMFAFKQTVKAQCPPLGSFTTISGPVGVCPGQSQQYTITAVTNAISYTWFLPPGAKINGQNPYTSASNTATVNFGPLYSSPGNICVYATNGCATIGPLCKTLGSQGVPSGASNISGSIYACPGDIVSYSVASVTNVTYNWTVPSGATVTSGQGTNAVSVTYGGTYNGGSICVSVSNGCASSAARCMALYNSKPKTPDPIVGNDIVCSGQTASYSTGPGSAVPVKTYTWAAPTGSIITGQGTANVTITFPGNFTSGDVSVRANNGCGSSSVRILKVRSQPDVPGLISGLAAGICNGTTSYSVNQQPNVVAYNWTVTGGGSVTGGQGTTNININYPPSFVSGKVCVTATNQCTTGGPRCLNLTKQVDISQNPFDFETCSSTDAVFAVVGVGMNLQYQWRRNGVNLANGPHVSGANSDSLILISADSTWAGSYDVIVSTTCNSQKTSTASQLLIKEVPNTPGDIAGVRRATCPGTTGVVYDVPLQSDATSFLWMHNQGVTIDNGQGSESVSLSFDSTINSGYRVYVFAENECGLSHDSSVSWTRYRISYPTVIGLDKVCENLTGVPYRSAYIAGADSFTWTAPPGATIVSGQGNDSIVIDYGASYTGGNITVTATNLCMTTPVKLYPTSINTPNIPSSLTGQTIGACNTTLNYTASSSTGATSYLWTLPPNSSIVSSPATSNNVSIQYNNPGTGTYSLCVAGVNYCRTGATRCISVKAVPDKPAAITSNPSVFCAFQSGLQFTTPGATGATSYLWLVPSGWSINFGQGNTTMTATSSETNGNVVVKGTNSCGNSGSRTFAVVMNCREGEDGAAISQDAAKTSLYPNPASDNVTLSFQTETSASYVINVFDILGKKVLVEGGISKAGMNEHTINIHSLTKGMYIVSLEGSQKSDRIKLDVK